MVNLRLRPATVKHTIEDTRRFLQSSSFRVSYEAISKYLRGYLGKAPKTYNQQIISLRRFVRDFLGFGDIISSFKMAPVDNPFRTVDLTKTQVRKGFYAQGDALSKALYLFTTTTGLRKGEILNLRLENIDLSNRVVIPNHFTRKKRSGVTFYNEETETWLKKYLDSRHDNNTKLFVISDRHWRQIWRLASKAADTNITAQRLRFWFATEMGEKLIPDRFIDIFQGRAPRSVIAKHYTGKGLDRLRRIYDKANLRILS